MNACVASEASSSTTKPAIEATPQTTTMNSHKRMMRKRLQPPRPDLGADLSRANVRDTRLDGADFTDATLSAADFTGATLRDTNFKKAEALERAIGLITQSRP